LRCGSRERRADEGKPNELPWPWFHVGDPLQYGQHAVKILPLKHDDAWFSYLVGIRCCQVHVLKRLGLGGRFSCDELLLLISRGLATAKQLLAYK
jgi:hypothetical protein